MDWLRDAIRRGLGDGPKVARPRRPAPKLSEPIDGVGCCEHGDHPCPPNRRFCSAACARCEHESVGENGCDGICGGESFELTWKDDAEHDHPPAPAFAVLGVGSRVLASFLHIEDAVHANRTVEGAVVVVRLSDGARMTVPQAPRRAEP